MTTESRGLVAERIWFAARVYPRVRTGKLSIIGGSLEFNDGRVRTMLPLADMEEIDIEIRPNIGLVWLADFVRWKTVFWWRTSHWHYLSIRAANEWISFRLARVKDRNQLLDDLLKLSRASIKGVISTVEN